MINPEFIFTDSKKNILSIYYLPHNPVFSIAWHNLHPVLATRIHLNWPGFVLQFTHLHRVSVNSLLSLFVIVDSHLMLSHDFLLSKVETISVNYWDYLMGWKYNKTGVKKKSFNKEPSQIIQDIICSYSSHRQLSLVQNLKAKYAFNKLCYLLSVIITLSALRQLGDHFLVLLVSTTDEQGFFVCVVFNLVNKPKLFYLLFIPLWYSILRYKYNQIQQQNQKDEETENKRKR